MRGVHRSALAAASVLLACLAASANAGVPATQQRCIATFGKAVRDVARAQGKTVARCLRDFAAGTLVASSPEACLLSDPSGRLGRRVGTTAAKVRTACPAGAPDFGLSPIDDAVARAGVGEVDLLHATIGDDLDTALVPDRVDASCQSQVVAALVKCADARRRVFLDCQRAGLRDGRITDASSLETTCLGSADDPQPDPGGRIAFACGYGLATTLIRRCAATDVSRAFPACQPLDATGLMTCLAAESACKLCQLLNDVDGLARDCDRFDDGNGANGSCGAECPDGVVQKEEACDDGNAADGDGCSGTCTVEAGWSCAGSPSVCAPTCGNGGLDAGEACDDGGTADGDGCSAGCAVERGWACSGEPSQCARNCGNGVVEAAEGERCDDGNATSGDGCSSTCQPEAGWLCGGQPSVCTFVCGNGHFEGDETCDDGNTASGDGCSASCGIEPGWLCSGEPSRCTPLCGDGLVRGGETCDDGNPTSGDGCSFSCQREPGWACAGEPSNCLPVCGDGFRRGTETCDDGNTASGDGCSGLFCRQEPGWTCAGQPSVCLYNCGNGHLDAQEECDDGNRIAGEGCGSSCRIEPGWACGSQPSVCVHSCGNGALEAGETCDDGNAVSGDGCSASCRNEAGWRCGTPGLPCAPFQVMIETPVHGTFTTAGAVTVTGHYTTLPPGQATVTINGEAADSVDPSARTFSHTVTLDGAAVFNPIDVALTNVANGDHVRDRIVVVAGNAVADGALSPQSVALRVNDTGIDAIEPLVGSLAAGQFDLATLVPTGTVVLPWQCYFQFIWCWAGASASVGSPPPSFSGVRFAADANPGSVGTNITLDNFRIDIAIDGTGIVPDCGLRLTADRVNLTGGVTLGPEAANPSFVNVDLASLNVGFTGFRRQFTYGSCGLVASRLGNIEQIAADAIKGFLVDPDGTGPEDSPLADAIEQALAGVSIAGAVSAGLGLHLDAPLFEVVPDASGITVGADSRFTVSIGSGPGQCIPPPGAPDLLASYAPPSTFPTFGPSAPTSGTPYGVAIGISPAGFNQLLRGQTECGLLRTSLTSIDVDGVGGAPPLAITSTLLSLLAPEFGQLPPNTPLRVDVAPTLAPIVTGSTGPGGELAELRIAQVQIDIVEPSSGQVWLEGAFDARLGMDLDFLPDGSGLSIHLSEPAAADTALTITYDPLGVDEAQLEAALPGIIRPLVPQLAGALASFPLPEFFGLTLEGVEVSRNGDFLSLFANLVPAP